MNLKHFSKGAYRTRKPIQRIGVKISFEADTFLIFITSSSVFVIVEQSADFIIASIVKLVKDDFRCIVLTARYIFAILYLTGEWIWQFQII